MAAGVYSFLSSMGLLDCSHKRRSSVLSETLFKQLIKWESIHRDLRSRAEGRTSGLGDNRHSAHLKEPSSG